MSFDRLKSVLRAVGSIIELSPTERARPVQRPIYFPTDMDALGYDFARVGDAFRSAIVTASKEVDAHGQRQVEQAAH